MFALTHYAHDHGFDDNPVDQSSNANGQQWSENQQSVLRGPKRTQAISS